MQIAWTIVNDSYHTDVCLRFPPFMIALSAIYISCVYVERDVRRREEERERERDRERQSQKGGDSVRKTDNERQKDSQKETRAPYRSFDFGPICGSCSDRVYSLSVHSPALYNFLYV